MNVCVDSFNHKMNKLFSLSSGPGHTLWTYSLLTGSHININHQLATHLTLLLYTLYLRSIIIYWCGEGGLSNQSYSTKSTKSFEQCDSITTHNHNNFITVHENINFNHGYVTSKFNRNFCFFVKFEIKFYNFKNLTTIFCIKKCLLTSELCLILRH